MDALLDGPSVTGAYEFKMRPGAVTSVDIHASLYFRQAVDRLGHRAVLQHVSLRQKREGPFRRHMSIPKSTIPTAF